MLGAACQRPALISETRMAANLRGRFKRSTGAPSKQSQASTPRMIQPRIGFWGPSKAVKTGSVRGLSQLPRIPPPSADRAGPPFTIHEGHRRRGTKHGVLGLHPLILPNHSTLRHVRSCRTVTIFRMKGLRPLDDDRREDQTAELPRRDPSRELDGLLGAGSHFCVIRHAKTPFQRLAHTSLTNWGDVQSNGRVGWDID
jgi:hypothetical protein